MNSAADHYASHLAPIYLWMAGGLETALARGGAEIDAFSLADGTGLVAVDLGAGFGMHAIPLARRGYSVLAVDTSAILLTTLWNQAGALPVRVIEGDLGSFPQHLEGPADLILCMGDTLTHLPDRNAVERLFGDVGAALREGGTFVVTFRDYTTPLTGDARFIPVRRDENRVLTCVLDYVGDRVKVHDVIHERRGKAWHKRVSAYQKLRLAPAWVMQVLQANGMMVRIEPGPAGMVRLVATRTGCRVENAEVEPLRRAFTSVIEERDRAAEDAPRLASDGD